MGVAYFLFLLRYSQKVPRFRSHVRACSHPYINATKYAWGLLYLGLVFKHHKSCLTAMHSLDLVCGWFGILSDGSAVIWESRRGGLHSDTVVVMMRSEW